MRANTEPFTPKRRTNYLTNKYILPEIAKSKNSYCVYLEDEHANFSEIIDASDSPEGPATDPVAFFEDALRTVLATTDRPVGTIIRVHTFAHVPLDETRNAGGRARNKTHAKCNFPPFQHFERTVTGWRLVGKSHWAGGLENGWFSTDHGRMTNRLAQIIMLMVERYSKKGNWAGYSYRDEMQGAALAQLVQAALQFNEAKSDNPFAYMTTVMTHAFIKVLNAEKKVQQLRDECLREAGVTPSFTAQLDAELAHLVPPPLKGRRGRPKTIKSKPVAEPKRMGRPKGSGVKPFPIDLPFEIIPNEPGMSLKRLAERREQIRYCIDAGVSDAAIARKFGVTQGTVWQIRRGKRGAREVS